MDNLPEIECNSCGWQGDTSELHCSDDDWNKPVDQIPFNLCPDCGSSDIDDYEDIESSNYEVE